jgi:hypothetical protein
VFLLWPLSVRITSATGAPVTPTTGDSSYARIPLPGERNVHAREFVVNFSTDPPGATVTKVKVDLEQGNGVVLQTIVTKASVQE